MDTLKIQEMIMTEAPDEFKEDFKKAEGMIKLFNEINSSVEVTDWQIVYDADAVPGDDDFYVRLETKHHSWLHLYINKNSKRLEWF